MLAFIHLMKSIRDTAGHSVWFLVFVLTLPLDYYLSYCYISVLLVPFKVIAVVITFTRRSLNGQFYSNFSICFGA